MSATETGVIKTSSQTASPSALTPLGGCSTRGSEYDIEWWSDEDAVKIADRLLSLPTGLNFLTAECLRSTTDSEMSTTKTNSKSYTPDCTPPRQGSVGHGRRASLGTAGTRMPSHGRRQWPNKYNSCRGKYEPCGTVATAVAAAAVVTAVATATTAPHYGNIYNIN